MKTCNKCLISKDLDCYTSLKYKEKIYKISTCKSCQNKSKHLKRKKNPLKEAARTRKVRLKSKYGITPERYNEMYIAQNGQCIICTIKYDKLAIDHCHDTKIIRGLLCLNCNTALGQFKDNISNLQRAIQYLQISGTNKP